MARAHKCCHLDSEREPGADSHPYLQQSALHVWDYEKEEDEGEGSVEAGCHRRWPLLPCLSPLQEGGPIGSLWAKGLAHTHKAIGLASRDWIAVKVGLSREDNDRSAVWEDGTLRLFPAKRIRAGMVTPVDAPRWEELRGEELAWCRGTSKGNILSYPLAVGTFASLHRAWAWHHAWYGGEECKLTLLGSECSCVYDCDGRTSHKSLTAPARRDWPSVSSPHRTR